MSRTWTLAVPVALACLVAGSPVQAQVGGRVVTAEGRPLPGATVEVWGRAVVHHVTATDADGAFTLSGIDPGRVTRYVFRYLGFDAEIVQADDFRPGMEVRLGESVYLMDGLEAIVSRERCPQDDDPEARALWASAAAGYDRRTSSRGIGARYRGRMGDVSERRLFEGLDGDIRVDFSIREAWPAGVRTENGRFLVLEEVVPTRGYAWKRTVEEPEYFLGRDRHMNWLYAELDGRSANHFVTATFGELHTFSMSRDGDLGMRVYFCPARPGGGRPTIRGSILVGSDGTLLEAEWRFATGDPDEEAGGWARFGVARDPGGGAPHLVARRGLFYRHGGFEKPFPNEPRWYFRDLRAWSGWTVSATRARPGSPPPP